jgi:hypothetical protein
VVEDVGPGVTPELGGLFELGTCQSTIWRAKSIWAVPSLSCTRAVMFVLAARYGLEYVGLPNPRPFVRVQPPA